MKPTQTTASPEPTRILVIETLYLGDLIHTLPLIQALRARYPAAQLDVLVRALHVPLMAHVAGIDQVLAMDAALHRSASGLLQLARSLRARQYDVVLNPGASDRATLLTWLSGGRHRLGRLNRNQSRRLWPLLHDEVIDHPWGAEPMYWQKLIAFAKPLQLDTCVRFGLAFSAVISAELALPDRYIHLSPFASEAFRSLPPATLLELLVMLRTRLPQCALLVSCGPSEQETRRLAVVLPAMLALGVRVFSGTLTLPQLGAVIQRAALHIGPDSGPLHLAVAVNTPAAACFLFKNASAEWMPVGPAHRCFGVNTKLEGGLYGLPLHALVEHAIRVMG